MAVTVNIYQENALRYLGTYGIAHQDRSTTWKIKDASMFALLCSTDLAQYSDSFAGTVQSLLTTGVTELTTGNGYYVGGRPAPINANLGSYPGGGNYSAASFLSGYSNGIKFLPELTRITSFSSFVTNEYDSLSWFASGGSISAKSLLLCIESPASPAATIYGRSYPLAMIDFGGTKTATNGNVFDINWNANGAINWTR